MVKLLGLTAVLAMIFAPARGWSFQEEGEIVSRSELLEDPPVNADHPIPRKVIAADEQEISSPPKPQKILAVHYRATPTSDIGMKDDRVVVALAEGDRYKILKVYESETAMVNGHLYSDNEFDQEFITIGRLRFLYIRNHISGSGGIVMHDVYSISSDGLLSIVPFKEESATKLLTPGEDLRNGQYWFKDEQFICEAGIYKSSDPECCPLDGAYHAVFRLTGDFKQDPQTGAFVPDFRFVIEKEWRSPDN